MTRPTWKRVAKAAEAGLRRNLGLPLATLGGRLMQWGPRPPSMIGAFPDRKSALASLPDTATKTYDDPEVARINFEVMCQTRVWDFPVMFWLDRLHAPGLSVLDAGGHFGTKYLAFGGRLNLGDVRWTVYDLPENVRAARAVQARGDVPAELTFIDDLGQAPCIDLLLASGLLQYLDIPFPDFIASLPNRPPHLLLNKVATRDGASVTTLEKIGPARVPYQIRCRAGFEAEIASAGYAIRDEWDIPTLSHVIGTHPALGASVSRGYLLECAAE